jgi:hypothetical protein
MYAGATMKFCSQAKLLIHDFKLFRRAEFLQRSTRSFDSESSRSVYMKI